MKITKKMIYNILFYSFIIFLFTPYGTGTRAKMTQGVTYIKTMIFAPKAKDIEERITVSSFDFPLKGISNATDINLQEKKGQVIFINYWATWCPPCVGEMPSLQNLYNEYKDKVVFVFLTSDDKEKVTNFYTKNKYVLPTYNMLGNPAPEINTKSLPTTFIIDKNGKIALKEVGGANWNSASTKRLLDNLINE